MAKDEKKGNTKLPAVEEKKTGTAVAAPVASTPHLQKLTEQFQAVPGLAGYTVEQNVTVRQLKLNAKNDTAYIEVLSPITQTERIDREGMSDKDKAMAAPKMAEVRDLTDGSGEVFRMIFPTVLESELDRTFPNQGYVGLHLAIRLFSPSAEDVAAGKRYNRFSIYKLKPPVAA